MTDTAGSRVDQLPRAFAYLDESGRKGMIRSLNEQDDADIALFVAVVVPEMYTGYFNDRVWPLFTEFAAAAAPAEKLHIAAAFKPGYSEWGSVAKDVRLRLFELLLQFQPKLIYAARRAGVSRRTRDQMRTLAPTSRRKPGDIPLLRDKIEGEAMSHLLEKIDAFGKINKHSMIPCLDRVDLPVAKEYQSMLKASRTRTNSIRPIRVPNQRTRSSDQFENRMSIAYTGNSDRDIHSDMNSTHVRDIELLTEVTAELFMADVVANALHHHLRHLENDAPLNNHAAVKDWVLNPIVWHGVENDFFDRI